MALTKTPVCNFGEKAKDFNLKSTENKLLSLNDVKGENGTLVMFICNHCPYVKAIIKDLVDDVKFLEQIGIKSVSIMSNDVKNYPEDSFENMISFSKLNKFSFPYLIDETQDIAKKYDVLNFMNVASRVTFYINKEGIIRHIDEDVTPATSAEDMVKNLEKLGVAKR